MVQPHVAQAHVDTGAIARQRAPTLKRVTEHIIRKSPPAVGAVASRDDLQGCACGVGATACDQPLHFNLGGRRGAARLMGAWERYAEVQSFEHDGGAGSDGRRRFKSGDVSDRRGGWSAAERTVLEMSVRPGVVVRLMPGHLRRVSRRTRLQQKRRAARRHEACGNVGSKQQHRQQDAAQQALPPIVKHRLAHTKPRQTMPWRPSVGQWGNTLHLTPRPPSPDETSSPPRCRPR